MSIDEFEKLEKKQLIRMIKENIELLTIQELQNILYKIEGRSYTTRGVCGKKNTK